MNDDLTTFLLYATSINISIQVKKQTKTREIATDDC